MDRREPRVGELVWFDDQSYGEEPPEPYDGTNGTFGVVTGHTCGGGGLIYCVVEILRYGKSTRGGGRIVGFSSLYPAHWTFVGPAMLRWEKYPFYFIGTWGKGRHATT